MKIIYTLLISPPGGGKTTWLGTHDYDIKIDDISVQPFALENLEKSIAQDSKDNRSHLSIAIADVNLCDPLIREKAYAKLTQIATMNKENTCTFEHILFVGSKEQYSRNVEIRNDGRNVAASIARFSPYMEGLKEMPDAIVIHLDNYKNKLTPF